MPHINNQSLNRWQQRTTQDRHNQSRRTNLSIRTHILECQTIDSWEHQTHANGHSHQAVNAHTTTNKYYHHAEYNRCSSKQGQHRSRTEVFHQGCTYEARTAEQSHCHDIQPLTQDFCRLFIHAFPHEHMCSILNDECPAGNLCSDIEELGNHTITISFVGKQTLEGWTKRQRHPPCFFLLDRNLGQENQHKHNRQQNANGCIGFHHHRQVRCLQGLKRGIVQQCTFSCRKRIHPCLDEIHRHEHTTQRPHGIERLCQVQSSCRRFRFSHRQNKRVGTRFQETQSASQDEISHQERIIIPDACCGDEHQRSDGIQSQSHQDTRLIAEALNEQCSRQCHTEIASVESHLHQRPFRHTHAENLRETLHHRVRDIIGKAPQGKAACYQDKRHQVIDTVFRCYRTLHCKYNRYSPVEESKIFSINCHFSSLLDSAAQPWN